MCGQVVDVLRSCYSGVWRFPCLTGDVPGFYYWSAPDATIYQGPNYFGSRNWHKGDGTPWPEFGERENTPQSWRDGSFPDPLPDLITLGTRTQIAGDEPCPPATWELWYGVPLPCWREDPTMIFKEVDNDPTFTHTMIASFNQADGFVLSRPAPTTTRVDLVEAANAQRGIVSLTDQVLGDGDKIMQRGGGAFELFATGVTSAEQLDILRTSWSLTHGFAAANIPSIGAGTVAWYGSFENNSSIHTLVNGAIVARVNLNATGFMVGSALQNLVIGCNGAWGLSATVNGLQYAGGLYIGGGISITSASITDFTTAVQTIGDARYQPLDADLTAIAAIGTTAYGRAALALVDAAAFRAYIGAGTGGGSVTSFSSGNLSPLFTASVATATSTPALSFTLTSQTANYVFAGPTSGSSTAPTFRPLVVADLPPLNNFAAAAIVDADQIPFTAAATGINHRLTALELTQYVLPAGSLQMFAGTTVPAGWLLCDGSPVSRTTYARLFAAINVLWGPGNGTTTFNVPDLRGRAPIGVGTGSGLSPRALTATGGTETITLAAGEIPTHKHEIQSSNHTPLYEFSGGGNFIVNAVTGGGATTWKTEDYSGGASHQNMQPWVAVNFIIRT